MAEKKTAAKATAKASKSEATAKAQPRLKALYNNELKAKLQKELGLDKGTPEEYRNSLRLY